MSGEIGRRSLLGDHWEIIAGMDVSTAHRDDLIADALPALARMTEILPLLARPLLARGTTALDPHAIPRLLLTLDRDVAALRDDAAGMAEVDLREALIRTAQQAATILSILSGVEV